MTNEELDETFGTGWREAFLAHRARTDAFTLRQAAYMSVPTDARLMADAQRLEALAETLAPTNK